MFIFDELELLAFFEREPRVSNEYGLDYAYTFRDSQYELKFGFNAQIGDCSLVVTAHGADHAVVSFAYLDSPGVRVMRDKRGEFLEVGAPGTAEGATSEWFVPERGLRMWLRPAIRVEGFGDA